MSSGISAKTAYCVSTFGRFYCYVCCAVGYGIHHFKAAANAAKSDRLVSFCCYCAFGCAVVYCSAKASADYKTAAFGNIDLNYSVIELIVTDYNNIYIFCRAIFNSTFVSADYAACAVVSGYFRIARYMNIVGNTHVVADYTADGKRCTFVGCYYRIFNIEIFYHSGIHSEKACTTYEIICCIGEVRYRML